MKQEIKYEEITEEVWKPEAGETIEGVYQRKEEDVGKHGSTLYHIRTAEGKSVKMWGSTVLDNKMASAEIGKQVKIVFEGIVENQNGSPVKRYKVYQG